MTIVWLILCGLLILITYLFARKVEQYRKVATHLWDIIDDIDTASDVVKDNDKLYRELVEMHQSFRWQHGFIDHETQKVKFILK